LGEIWDAFIYISVEIQCCVPELQDCHVLPEVLHPGQQKLIILMSNYVDGQAVMAPLPYPATTRSRHNKVELIYQEPVFSVLFSNKFGKISNNISISGKG
jgi:hypothetical protein